MNNDTIKDIEYIIKYTFNDKSLLERAMTHSSKVSDHLKNYQSLEFLGDSIVDFIASEHLLEIYPKASEGELTKYRQEIVSQKPLANVIEKLGLVKYLSKESNVSASNKMKSDIFESITAAIYLDSKDISIAKNFVISNLSSVFNEVKASKIDSNYKSQLQEYCAKRGIIVSYELLDSSGPCNDITFTVSCKIGDDVVSKASGHSKKEAEQKAAEEALKYIFNKK